MNSSAYANSYVVDLPTNYLNLSMVVIGDLSANYDREQQQEQTKELNKLKVQAVEVILDTDQSQIRKPYEETPPNSILDYVPGVGSQVQPYQDYFVKYPKYKPLIDTNIYASRNFMWTAYSDSMDLEYANVLDKFRKDPYQVLLFIEQANHSNVSAVFISLMEAKNFSAPMNNDTAQGRPLSLDVPGYDVCLYDPLVMASSNRLMKRDSMSVATFIDENVSLKKLLNRVLILSGSFYTIMTPAWKKETKSWLNNINHTLGLELYKRILYGRNRDAYNFLSMMKDDFLFDYGQWSLTNASENLMMNSTCTWNGSNFALLEVH